VFAASITSASRTAPRGRHLRRLRHPPKPSRRSALRSERIIRSTAGARSIARRNL
jgi:hypothetical protein